MQQAIKRILHMRSPTFAMPFNSLPEIMSSMKDVMIQTHAEEIKLPFEVGFLCKTGLESYIDEFLGIFYQGLGRLYERTRDDGIAQVIEASYFAMLSHVNSRTVPRSKFIVIDIYRSLMVDIHCR